MNIHEKSQQLSDEDGRLVDLVTAALVDPNLHTDLRMRLSELLQATHEDLHGPAGRETHERLLAPHDQKLEKTLEAMLVDPNLHTDLRMRLHNEISEIVRAAHQRAEAH